MDRKYLSNGDCFIQCQNRQVPPPSCTGINLAKHSCSCRLGSPGCTSWSGSPAQVGTMGVTFLSPSPEDGGPIKRSENKETYPIFGDLPVADVRGPTEDVFGGKEKTCQEMANVPV